MARRTLEGWDRLKRRLEKIPKAVREQTQPAITSAAQDVAAVMKALAPVDDGDLKDSIEVTPGGQKTPPHSQPGRSTVVPANAAMITVSNSKVRYAHLVEFGTRAHLNGGQFAGTKTPAAGRSRTSSRVSGWRRKRPQPKSNARCPKPSGAKRNERRVRTTCCPPGSTRCRL